MGNNMVSAEVTIRGTRPILWHWFGPDALPLEKKERTGVAGNDPEEWRKTCLATKDGQLYVEPTYVFSTIVGGGKYVKSGRYSIQKKVAATLQCTDNRVLFDRWMPGANGNGCDLNTLEPPPRDSDLPVYLDVRGVVNPNTRSRNVRYRVAASPGWTCTFHIMWDKTIVSRPEMESVVLDAGKLVGIGNGRAIGMGRFEVAEFAVSDG